MSFFKQHAALIGWSVTLASGVTLIASSYRPVRAGVNYFTDSITLRGGDFNLLVFFVGALVVAIAGTQLVRIATQQH